MFFQKLLRLPSMHVSATGTPLIRSYPVLSSLVRIRGRSSKVSRSSFDGDLTERLLGYSTIQNAFLAALKTYESIEDQALLEYIL